MRPGSIELRSGVELLMRYLRSRNPIPNLNRCSSILLLGVQGLRIDYVLVSRNMLSQASPDDAWIHATEE